MLKGDSMTKTSFGAMMPPIAFPICMAGSNIEGRPNYCTLAWFTMIDDIPPTIGLVMAKERRTKDGMLENGTFSVNLPSTALAAATDYVGITSGHEADKSEVFESFYGTLGTAPMIEECPVTMECELLRIVEFETTDMIVGRIVGLYADEGVFNDKVPDAGRMDPLLYLSTASTYHHLGERMADAFKIGKTYRR